MNEIIGYVVLGIVVFVWAIALVRGMALAWFGTKYEYMKRTIKLFKEGEHHGCKE